MSLRDAWNDGLDWAGGKLDDVKEYATDKAVSIGTGIVMDNYKKSITDAFGGPSKMTPELEAAGWKPGLDGIPYNPAIAYTAEDWANDQKNANANTGSNTGGAGTTAQSTASSEPFLSQDLSQRTPSGTIYNPSMDAFNESSLFNYEGPGGVPEYTYGEGLRTGGGGYGTPPGPNLYYEGQYGEGRTTPEITPPQITLPPVLPPITMPEGIPPTNTAPITTPPAGPAGTPDGGGNAPINTGTFPTFGGGNGPAPSTTITDNTGSGPIGNAPIGTPSLFPNFTGPSGMTMKPSYINEPQGDSQYVNSGMTMPSSYINEPQGDSQYVNSGMTMPADESGIAGTQQFMPSGMTMPADESGIAGTQQFMPSGMTMPADESGISGTQQQLPANTVINPFEDSMSQPIVGASSGDLNSLSTYSPTYGDPNNIASNYTYADTLDGGQEQLIFPEIIEEAPINVPKPSNPMTGPAGSSNTLNTDNLFNPNQNLDFEIDFSEINSQPVNPIKPQYGLDELFVDGLNYVSGFKDSLFDDKTYNPPLTGPAGSTADGITTDMIAKEPSIWSSVMDTIAGVAGNNFKPTPSNPPLDAVAAIGGGSGTTFTPTNTGDMFEYDGSYDNAPGSDAAIDAIIAQNQGGIFNPPPVYNTPPVGPPSVISQPAPPPVYIPSPVNPPSIFTQPSAPVYTPPPRPKPAPAPVYNTPPSAPPSVISRPRPPVSRPTYTWKPSYAGGSGGF